MCTCLLGAIAIWQTARRTGFWNNRCGCAHTRQMDCGCGCDNAVGTNYVAPAPVVTNACDAVPAEIWENVNRRGCGCNCNCHCR